MGQLQKILNSLPSRYGDSEALLLRFNPQNQCACAKAVNKSADAPLMIELIKGYGENVVVQLVVNQLADYYLYRRTDYTAAEMLQTARLMVSVDKFRLMNIAFVMTFFWELKTGEYEVYSADGVNIMTAFQKYYNKAIVRQREIIQQERNRKEAYEAEEHRKLVMKERELIKQGLLEAPKPIDYTKIGVNIDKINDI